MKRILIIDDNLTICLMLKSWLVKENYHVDTVTGVEDAKVKVKSEAYDLILSDIRMPETDGFSFLSWVKKFDSDILVIMMTGFADIETAVESMKMGAVDYIAKPIEAESLYAKIANALSNQKKINLNNTHIIKPKGQVYAAIFEKLTDVIHNDSYLLIIGESGTGKTSTANYIYTRSGANKGAFVTLDLQTPTLGLNGANGAEEQSFAHSFKQAKGGLLLVKNVHKADLNAQTALLKALTAQAKDKDFVQIIATTPESMERLNSVLLPKLNDFLQKSHIILPTLQNNHEAILLYAEYFLELANRELNKKIQRIDKQVLNALYQHTWTGNIQELKNLIFKACLMTDDENVISQNIIPQLFNNFRPENAVYLKSPGQSVERLKKENYEKEKITEALEIAKGNKTVAASILNIDRKTLYNKIKLYEVDVD